MRQVITGQPRRATAQPPQRNKTQAPSFLVQSVREKQLISPAARTAKSNAKARIPGTKGMETAIDLAH
eukprot:139411-Rhodomonas_salina.3